MTASDDYLTIARESAGAERSQFSLENKTALVTGGGSGIGLGIAEALCRAGAKTLIIGRTETKLRTVAHEARDKGLEIQYFVADITQETHVDRAIAHMLVTFGCLDCLVNNAGGASANEIAPLLNLRATDWERVVHLNLTAPFLVSRAAVEVMAPGSSIINISSMSASQPSLGVAHYAAAKAGLENLTKSMAGEWGPRGIRVNAVSPGVIDTIEKREHRSEDWRTRQAAASPLGRLGTPADIGQACVYLASDAAAWVTGITLPVQGLSARVD